MRPSQALTYAVLLLLLLLACSSSFYASVLEDTCKRFGANYHNCIKLFEADKDSATADKRGLAFIGIKIARATAVSTRERIATLKAADKDKKIQGPLTDCDEKYTGAVMSLDEAVRHIASGKLRDAVTNLGDVQEVPESCEEVFQDMGVKKSPLAAEGYEFAWECSATRFVTRMML